jgi:hypothetical protein
MSRVVPYVTNLLHLDEMYRALLRIERKVENMPTIQEVKDAVAAASAKVVSDIKTAITAETTEIAGQIAVLKDIISQGKPIAQADLDALLASVNGIPAAVVPSVAAISDNDGGNPPPPPLP